MKSFEGVYIKCEGKETVAFIFGRSTTGEDGTSFIQVITEDNSYFAEYDYFDYHLKKTEK